MDNFFKLIDRERKIVSERRELLPPFDIFLVVEAEKFSKPLVMISLLWYNKFEGQYHQI